MSSSLGEAVLDITGDTSKLEGSLNSAKTKTTDMLNNLSRIGGMITPVLMAATAGVIALGAASFLAAARVDELKSVVGILADNADISRESVYAVAEAIRGQGIESAVAYQSVAQLMRANIDLSKASDLARVAQDAAVISGQNSTDTYNNIIEGIVKLNTEILRTSGITVDGSLAYDAYAESIGKSADELTTAEKQQALLNAVLEAGIPIAGAYAAAMKEPGKVLRSFPRYINDIFVAIGNYLKPALGEAVMGIAKFLKNLGEAVDKGGAFSAVLKKIGDAIAPLAKAFADWIGNIDFDKVAGALSVAVDVMVGAVQWLFDTLKGFYDLVKNDNGIVVAIVTTLGLAIAAAAWTAIAPLLPLIATFALVAGAVYLLYTAWTENWGGIQEKMAAVWAWLQPILQNLWTWLSINLPIAIQALSDFWTNTLLPALQTFWTWVTTTLVPMLTDLWTWLSINIPIAIQALSDFWTNTLLPAITAVWSFISTVLWPLFENLVTFLGTVFGVALKVLAAVWQNVLKPVLQIVWGFISGSLFPLFETLAEFLGAVFGVAVRVLAGIWENVLAPALKGVWDWFGKIYDSVKKDLQPLLDNFGIFVAGAITNKLNDFNGILASVQQAFKKIADAILNVIQKIKNMIAWMNRIAVPDFGGGGGGPGRGFGGTATPMAAGGDFLVRRPTLFLAGDAGDEYASFTPAKNVRGGSGAGNTYVTYNVSPHYYKGDEPSLLEELKLIGALARAG